MTRQLDVSTLGGQVFTVQAKEEWSVWELKCVIEKVSGVHGNKQKLINHEFDELLNERPLQDFCPEGDEIVELALITLGKSQEEAEWLELWAKITPDWLQDGTEKVIGQDDFSKLRSGNRVQEQCTLHPKPMRCSCRLVSTSLGGGVKVLRGSRVRGYRWGHEPIAEASVPTPLLFERGKDVLAALKQAPYEMRSLSPVELEWNDTKGMRLYKHKATLEAVLAAIGQDADTVMPQIVSETLAMSVMQHCPGCFSLLPESMQESRSVLFVAMEADPALEAEFRSTAGATEIREWEWHRGDSGRRKGR